MDLVRRIYRDPGLTGRGPEKVKVIERAMADAEAKFVGIKRTVECAYAIERYGPNGSEFAGLIRRMDP